MDSDFAGPAGPARNDAGGGFSARHADPQRLCETLSGDGWGPLWTGFARVGGILPPPRHPDTDPWALLRGWGDPSRRGGADGRLVGDAGRADVAGRPWAGRPWFDAPVAPRGYRWWYVDAISDDGAFGLTVIGFIGSVFSPYYRASGRAVPTDHSCLNIALYGRRGARWVMTERGDGATHRTGDTLAIGPSAMRWDSSGGSDRLVIEIEERDIRLGIPWRRRVAGRIVLHPEVMNAQAFRLDPAGRHHWQAIAPRARVEVEMDAPALRWSGSGYFDSNHGSEPIEDGFTRWHWSRAHLARGAAVTYEGVRRDGSPFASALRFGADGVPHEEPLPLVAPLPATSWLLARQTRGDRGLARVVKTWENAPFYARTAIETRLFGEHVHAVQESISLDRLIHPVVQFMLPYKMPREPG